MKKCAICNTPVEREDAPILTMGAYGIPRCLCDGCDTDLTAATEGTEYDEIVTACEKIGKRAADSSHLDKESLMTVKELLSGAMERAESIRLGSYDFEKEESEDSYEIPEELLECEEDRELDRRDEEKNDRFDKIFNWVAYVTIGAAVAFFIYRILDAYIF